MKNWLKKIYVGLFAVCTFLILFYIYFNRVPDRVIPQGNVVVAPANGKIIGIEEVDQNMISFFKNDIENKLTVNKIDPPYKIIVIEMNLKNVHVQRAPISGEIIDQEYFEGKHKNALSSDNLEQLANVNEKNLIVIKNDSLSVGVVQVAGIAARRIQSFVKINDRLDKGDIYGRILLGSQVVLIIPGSVSLNVKVGDVLIDGESIIATY